MSTLLILIKDKRVNGIYYVWHQKFSDVKEDLNVKNQGWRAHKSRGLMPRAVQRNLIGCLPTDNQPNQ